MDRTTRRNAICTTVLDSDRRRSDRAPSRAPAIRHLAVAFALLVGAQPALAEVFCVGTGDELNEALELAGWAFADEVRLRAGTYKSQWNAVGAPVFFYKFPHPWFIAGAKISGGWNHNCTVQTLDPTLTRLDAEFRGPVFGFIDPWASERAAGTEPPHTEDFSLSNMTLANGKTQPGLYNGFASGLHWAGVFSTPSTELRFEHLIITGNQTHNTGNFPRVVELGMVNAGTIVFRNNVVAGNNMSGHAASGNVVVDAANNSFGYLINNSIHDNLVGGTIAGVRVAGTVELSNNVIADNASATAPATFVEMSAFAAHHVALRNNHIGQYTQGGFAINQGTTTGIPQWTQSGLLRIPSAISVLRNSGLNAPPGGGLTSTDIRNVTRIIDGTVDRGAVEAQAAANTGPLITALEPLSGSTTILPATAGATRDMQLLFLTQGGTGGGQTTVDCAITSGFGAITLRETQTVSTGGFALPVTVTMDNPVSGDNTVDVRCDVFRENATSSVLTYRLIVRRAVDQVFQNSFE